jgi:hypothetical protein
MRKKRTHKELFQENGITPKKKHKFLLEDISNINNRGKIKINSSILNINNNNIPIVPESDLKFIENVAEKKEEINNQNNIYFTSKNIFQMFFLFRDFSIKLYKQDNQIILEITLYENQKIKIQFKLISLDNEEEIEYIPIKINVNLKEEHNIFLDNLIIKKTSIPILLEQLRQYKNNVE